uniref:Protein LTV1 homolog n=1 Tax=Glossina palpalis gambiensis TaxID=67801 RepID=A0A1B0BEP5_9MUSC
MGKSKKSFIDRKNAVTFHLVHRSQHDPLITDETAPQRVLLEASARQSQKGSTTVAPDAVKRKEEQRKYGIDFDDEYDYLQHLKQPEQEVVWEYAENPNQAKKGVNEKHVLEALKLVLPSSVFASEYEEPDGLLNKAAPQPGPHPDWDPDVVAALDGDFDFDNENNQLEDDFIIKAMGDEETNQEQEESLNSIDFSDGSDIEELGDDLGPLTRNCRFVDEETKSRFTEYSMSSSVMHRNEQLTLLDDRFERFYATYDDPELGDLATEEIEGAWHQKHPHLMDCMQEFKKSKKALKYNKEWDRQRIEKYRYVADGDLDPNEQLVEVEVEDPKRKKWDCESILSTYSNIYNHPKLIEEPKNRSRCTSCSTQEAQNQKIVIDSKTGIPMNVLRGGNNKVTAKALAKLDGGRSSFAAPKSLCDKSVLSTLSVLSIRPKDETCEERRERKRLVKEYRNERRIERKANAEAFKNEKKRQINVKINRQQNQQGTKIM